MPSGADLLEAMFQAAPIRKVLEDAVRDRLGAARLDKVHQQLVAQNQRVPFTDQTVRGADNMKRAAHRPYLPLRVMELGASGEVQLAAFGRSRRQRLMPVRLSRPRV